MNVMDKSEQLDSRLQLLASHYRRWILYLLSSKNIVTVEELVAELTKISKRTNDEFSERDLTVRLHQIDLPKLADADLIEYNRQEGSISLQNTSVELTELLLITKRWEDQRVQDALSDRTQ